MRLRCSCWRLSSSTELAQQLFELSDQLAASAAIFRKDSTYREKAAKQPPRGRLRRKAVLSRPSRKIVAADLLQRRRVKLTRSAANHAQFRRLSDVTFQ